MRTIAVTMMITLDGVIQSPGAPEEDPSNGFKYGGWVAPYWDEAGGDILDKELVEPFDLLLGAKTYGIFAEYWPKHPGSIGTPFDKATKYVVSDKPVDLPWEKSVLIDGDVVAKLKALKEENGLPIQVHGSGRLVQTLLQNDLVDELRLRTFPITLGTGQRLFEEGTIPAAFELLKADITPSGVIMAHYKKVGKPQTGLTVDPES